MHNKTREFWRPLLEEYWKRFDWKEDYTLGLTVVKSKPSTSRDASNGLEATPGDSSLSNDAELALQQEVKQATLLVRIHILTSHNVLLTCLCIIEH